MHAALLHIYEFSINIVSSECFRVFTDAEASVPGFNVVRGQTGVTLFLIVAYLHTGKL